MARARDGEDLGRDRLSVGAVVTVAVAAGLATLQVLTSRLIDVNHHCGFDGERYCRMAQGQLAPSPYSRRVVTPLAVRALHFGSVLDRFLVIDVVSIAAATYLVFALTRRLATGSSANRRTCTSAALIAASLVILNPWVLHAPMTYPALTDPLSLALGLGWVLALTRRPPLLSLPLAALTVLCREAWAPPMLVALVACWLLLPVGRRWWVTNAVLVVGAAVASLNMPRTRGNDPSFATTATEQLRTHFTTTQGFLRFVWMVASGLGFVVVLVVLVFSMRTTSRTRALIGVVLALAMGHIAMAVVGGTDTDRIIVPAAALLTPVALVAVAQFRSAEPTLAVTVLASVAIWQPWRRVMSNTSAWLGTFAVHAIPWEDMRTKLFGDAYLLAIVALIAVIYLILTFRRPIER